MHVWHEELNALLLNVERLEEARKARLEDVAEVVLVEHAYEARVRSLVSEDQLFVATPRDGTDE